MPVTDADRADIQSLGFTDPELRDLADQLGLAEQDEPDKEPPSKRRKTSSAANGFPEGYERIHKALGVSPEPGKFPLDFTFMYVRPPTSRRPADQIGMPSPDSTSRPNVSPLTS